MKLPTLRGSRPLRYAAATLLVAAVAGGVLVMISRTGQAVTAVPAVSAVPAPGINGREAAISPEALLFRTLHEVSNKRLDSAVSEVDKIISTYPNFRLAHLIKGDLLLARTRPLTTVGNAAGAPKDQLEDLREEARARLARFQHQRPVGLTPRYLVQMQPEQRHALVVDTAKSTLYVFENRGGEARYVTDYYVSIGKNGIDKFREGDNKTPLGVYHVTGSLSRDRLNSIYGKLAEQYGVGALPISYPNEWDRREGRNGYGIWLHGVPFDTYSRPPRASNGCVALTNEDFTAVSRGVQTGLTPVIIANGVDWVAPGATRAVRQELVQRIESWRRDWESLDTDKYLTHYASGFSAGKMDLEQWSEQKRKVNAGKSWIKLKLGKASIFLYPGRDDLAVVSFDQDYASSNLVNQMRKRQYWIRERGAWRILNEGSA
ncbi:MAG: L,D-transpeptidase family protein [Betaproteobacteria bacterium]|nr:L,D-transpeptidase family protein [Betaproteobacteria bacterium]